jgi:hypothetical protein
VAAAPQIACRSCCGVAGPNRPSASGCCHAVDLVSSTFEISQEDQEDRRSEGGKNAFFNSDDRIEKYSSEVQKSKTGLQTAGGSANPQALGLLPF